MDLVDRHEPRASRLILSLTRMPGGDLEAGWMTSASPRDESIAAYEARRPSFKPSTVGLTPGSPCTERVWQDAPPVLGPAAHRHVEAP
ncbi:hypothetical protein SANTM175S_00902 [Streptomyces antimycoticus]